MLCIYIVINYYHYYNALSAFRLGMQKVISLRMYILFQLNKPVLCILTSMIIFLTHEIIKRKQLIRFSKRRHEIIVLDFCFCNYYCNVDRMRCKANCSSLKRVHFLNITFSIVHRTCTDDIYCIHWYGGKHSVVWKKEMFCVTCFCHASSYNQLAFA